MNLIATDLAGRAPTPGQFDALRELFYRANQMISGRETYRTENVRYMISLARRGLVIALNTDYNSELFIISDAGRAYIEERLPKVAELRRSWYPEDERYAPDQKAVYEKFMGKRASNRSTPGG